MSGNWFWTFAALDMSVPDILVSQSLVSDILFFGYFALAPKFCASVETDQKEPSDKTRVTRLGEFSPFWAIVYFWHFF
jgi:hypothetical protein